MNAERRFERYCDRLSDRDLLTLHRVVARRTVPIWREVKPGIWEAGMNAARAKQARSDLDVVGHSEMIPQ